MSDFLDEIYENIDTLSDISTRLNSLGLSFNNIGNDIIGHELLLMSYNIKKCGEDIGKATSKDINEKFNHSIGQTGKILWMSAGPTGSHLH